MDAGLGQGGGDDGGLGPLEAEQELDNRVEDAYNMLDSSSPFFSLRNERTKEAFFFLSLFPSLLRKEL